MKNSMKPNLLLYIATLALILAQYQVQSIYFYLERGQEKCFKDEVVKNYVRPLHHHC